MGSFCWSCFSQSHSLLSGAVHVNRTQPAWSCFEALFDAKMSPEVCIVQGNGILRGASAVLKNERQASARLRFV